MNDPKQQRALRVVAADDPATADVDADADASLVQRARGGDAGAWSRLYQKQFDPLYRYIAYLVGDRTVTEDLVQETFIQALLGIAKFRAEARFDTWLRSIALNVTRRHFRKTKSVARTRDRFMGILQTQVAGMENLEDLHADVERARALYAVLDRLPVKLREAFVLRDIMGLSSAEAGAQIGVTPGHVAVRAHRARRRVRQELARLGWVEPPSEAGR